MWWIVSLLIHSVCTDTSRARWLAVAHANAYFASVCVCSRRRQYLCVGTARHTQQIKCEQWNRKEERVSNCYNAGSNYLLALLPSSSVAIDVVRDALVHGRVVCKRPFRRRCPARALSIAANEFCAVFNTLNKEEQKKTVFTVTRDLVTHFLVYTYRRKQRTKCERRVSAIEMEIDTTILHGVCVRQSSHTHREQHFFFLLSPICSSLDRYRWLARIALVDTMIVVAWLLLYSRKKNTGEIAVCTRCTRCIMMNLFLKFISRLHCAMLFCVERV